MNEKEPRKKESSKNLTLDLSPKSLSRRQSENKQQDQKHPSPKTEARMSQDALPSNFSKSRIAIRVDNK